MSFQQNLICNLHEVARQTTDPKTKEQLMNLWRNTCNFKRAKETIGLSVHSELTIRQSKSEINMLSSAKDLISTIILK